MHSLRIFGIVRVAAAAAALAFFGTAALAASNPLAVGGVDVRSAPRGHDVTGQATANGQVIARTLFQKEIALDCPGANGVLCISQIYKVPDKHRLEISKVTCFVNYADGNVTFTALTVGSLNFSIPMGSTWNALTSGPSENHYTFETDAPAFAIAGQVVAGIVVGESSGLNPSANATCAIFGSLVTLK